MGGKEELEEQRREDRREALDFFFILERNVSRVKWLHLQEILGATGHEAPKDERSPLRFLLLKMVFIFNIVRGCTFLFPFESFRYFIRVVCA